MGDGDPEQNPFAAPQSGPETADVELSDDQPYRVIDTLVYCRSELDLHQYSWLTGETEGLVGTVKKTVKASPRWLNTTFSLILFGCFGTYLTLNALGLDFRFVVRLVYPMMIANFVLQSWFGIKVKVVVGQSHLAKSKALAATRFSRWLLAYILMFLIAAAIAYLSFDKVWVWVIIITAILGLVLGVVFYVRHRPREVSVMAIYHDKGVFRLAGLRQELLASIMLNSHHN